MRYCESRCFNAIGSPFRDTMKLFVLLASLLVSFPAFGKFDRDTVVFVGSSSIELWKDLPASFPGLKTKNLGVAATTYSYLVDHVEEWADKYPARRFVVYSGDNDIAWGSSSERVAGLFREFATRLRRKIPDVKIFVLSVKPNSNLLRRLRMGTVRKTNLQIEQEAARLGFATYVDIFSLMLDGRGRPRGELFGFDGIHMNASGYEVWARALRPLLRK